jgi:molecular chaperone GrpE
MIKKKHEKEQEQLENEPVQASAEQSSSEQQIEEPNIDGQPQTEQKQTEAKAQPELSETDILKLYLEQSINEMKKARKEVGDAKKELEESKAQAIQFKEKLASLMTEYENYRRRTAAEKEAIYANAVCKSASELLPVLDSLELAMPFAESNPQSFKQGVEMTLKQLMDGFKSLGIEEIEAHNCEFNPDVHNAVMHVEDENHNESTVTEVFQKGFKYCDKVIRHSMVKVAN